MDRITNTKPPQESRDSADRGSNQSDVRAHNERLVLSLVRRRGPLAKAEIARITGLSAQTVSVIMRALEKEHLLAKCDPVRGKVGQPSVPMRLLDDGAFFYGLKIGRRSSELVLTNFVGKILARVNEVHDFPTPDSTIQFVVEAIIQLRVQLPKRHQSRIAGLGIAMPFQLWDWPVQSSVSYEDMESWQARDIQAEIADRVECPIFLSNDATAACGAELVFGSNDRPRNFLYLYVGYFIGGGIVLNGCLYPGQSGNAGALGSLPVPSGDCSQQLVEVASLSVLESQLDVAGLQSNIQWQNTDAWSVDPVVTETWMETASRGIAHAIAAACSVIDFKAVVIDGQIPPDIRRDLVDRTEGHLNRLNLAGITAPEMQEGTIGRDARVLGAASLPLSERFLVDQYIQN